MKKFRFEDYQGKYVMWCKSEEEATKFCKFMHDSGKKWANGDTYEKYINYKYYTVGTSYNFNNGTYCPNDYYTKNGYTVLEYSNFDWSEENMFSKKDLRNGDFVVRRDGSVECVLLEIGTLLGRSGGWNELDTMNQDLTRTSILGHNKFDIVKVYRPRERHHACFENFHMGELVYEREEVVEMTVEEISKALGKKVKVV